VHCHRDRSRCRWDRRLRCYQRPASEALAVRPLEVARDPVAQHAPNRVDVRNLDTQTLCPRCGDHTLHTLSTPSVRSYLVAATIINAMTTPATSTNFPSCCTARCSPNGHCIPRNVFLPTTLRLHVWQVTSRRARYVAPRMICSNPARPIKPAITNAHGKTFGLNM